MNLIKKYIIFLLCILHGCNSPAQNSTLCEEYNKKSAELVFEYQMYEDISKLDSALYYIELSMPICSFKHLPNLVGRKLGILSIKHDYDAGIDYISTIADSLISIYPYYKTVLLKRFYAMKCLYEGDTIQRNKYVHSIIEDIEPFIIEQQSIIDSICKNDLSQIFQNRLFLAPQQYYFYKSIIEDSVTFKNELDKLKQKGYNPEYIELIEVICKEDFLIYQLY